jgi:hypothetical protein
MPVGGILAGAPVAVGIGGVMVAGTALAITLYMPAIRRLED